MMRWSKTAVIVCTTVLLPLSLASCGGRKKQPEPPVIVEAPDYKPLAEGWKVQSYALIGIAVIVMVGLIIRKGDH